MMEKFRIWRIDEWATRFSVCADWLDAAVQTASDRRGESAQPPFCWTQARGQKIQIAPHCGYPYRLRAGQYRRAVCPRARLAHPPLPRGRLALISMPPAVPLEYR